MKSFIPIWIIVYLGNSKHLPLTFFTIVLFQLNIYPQTEIPTLLEKLKEGNKDTAQVWVYRDLAYYYLEKNLDSSFYYSQLGVSIAHDLNFTKGEIWTLYQKALAEEFMDRFDSSIISLKKALSLAESHADSLSMAKLTNALGVTQHYQGNFKEALNYYQNALSLAEIINYHEGAAQSLNNLGIIYRQKRNFRKALDIYQRSLEIKNIEKDTVGIINTRYNLGLLHSYLNDFEKSLLEFSLAEKLAGTRRQGHHLAEIKIGKGMAMYNLDNHEEAKKYFEEGLKQLGEDKIFEKIAALTYLGILKVRSGEQEAGMRNLTLAHNMVEQSDRLELKRQVTREMAIAYEILNQPEKSVTFWKAYNLLNDSINNEQRHWAFEEMQARFEAIEKDKKIQMQELALIKEKQQRKKAGILLYSAFFLTLSAIFFYVYTWRNKHQDKVLPTSKTQETDHLDFEKINLKLLSPLTNREQEIILLVEQGMTNQEIAKELFVSENTIKTHLKNIFSKIQAINRTDLIHKLRSL